MCDAKLKNKTVLSCPSCAEEMFVCAIDKPAGRLKVEHYPGMKNVTRAAAFDVAEEITIEGLGFSRKARRLHSDGRLFLSCCSGVCLSCNNPFSVLRVVSTSGPVPSHLSAVDHEHGYRSASIYGDGTSAFSGLHLLEDVMHHNNYYGYWLESWSAAFPWCTKEDSEFGELVDQALVALRSIGENYRTEHQPQRMAARIN